MLISINNFLLILILIYKTRPCILIFDSLGGASRGRVVATLREYLNWEYKSKYPDKEPRVFTKENMQGTIVKVPQQLNFTDCGLFLLQYVENFFISPIEDFRFPIKSHINWFPQDVVSRKREDISNIIKKLMEKQNVKDVELPKLEFQSIDANLIETAGTNESTVQADDAFGDEVAGDEDYNPTEEEIKESEQSATTKKVYVSNKNKRNLETNETPTTTPKTSKRSKV